MEVFIGAIIYISEEKKRVRTASTACGIPKYILEQY